jgi:hypothetical protein
MLVLDQIQEELALLIQVVVEVLLVAQAHLLEAAAQAAQALS